MTNLNKETIQTLTQLCRINCSEEEQEALLFDLRKIVAYFELLEEIDTKNVAPCNHVVPDVKNVMRDDTPGETMPRAIFLANAPSQVGGMIRVPPVIKQG